MNMYDVILAQQGSSAVHLYEVFVLLLVAIVLVYMAWSLGRIANGINSCSEMLKKIVERQ